MARKLLDVKAQASSILWIMDYLKKRPQFVKMCNKGSSDFICTNTGAPQGTVLLPFLFSLYAAESRASSQSCSLNKFSDDSGLTLYFLRPSHSWRLQRSRSVLTTRTDTTLGVICLRRQFWRTPSIDRVSSQSCPSVISPYLSTLLLVLSRLLGKKVRLFPGSSNNL